MAQPKIIHSLLDNRVRTLRLALPVAAFALVLTHQIVEHTLLRALGTFEHFLSQLLFYGVIGPAAVFVTLTWIGRRVRERDIAEGHLKSLYEVSLQSGDTADPQEIVHQALRAPEEILGPAKTSLISRDYREGPWTLLGSNRLADEEVKALEAYLLRAGGALQCDQCIHETSGMRARCELLAGLNLHTSSSNPYICLPLSVERPPQALLLIDAGDEVDLNIAQRHTP